MLNFVTILDNGCRVSAQQCSGGFNLQHGIDVGCRMKAYKPSVDRDQPCIEKEMSGSRTCNATTCAVSKNKQGIILLYKTTNAIQLLLLSVITVVMDTTSPVNIIYNRS